MEWKNLFKRQQRFSPLNLSKSQNRHIKKVAIELQRKNDYLAKQDIEDWRKAWQFAINIDNPNRQRLYDIYTIALVDLHLSGCIEQRQNMVLKKSFRIIGKDGKEDKKLTALFETQWFKDFMVAVLDSRYWGHSLIELGDIVNKKFSYARIVPRKHVIPEYKVILRDTSDSISNGISYVDSNIADWCIEAGGSHDLGLLLKCSPSAISKRHMLAFWDGFGEMFGMPIRIAKTSSRDDKDSEKIENMLENMGAASWGLFPEGTEVELIESSRGDAFNVYDKRIDRANSEISKGILNQTMTIDSGSSLSQSEVHLEVFNNVVEKDADFLCDVVNDKLIPLMCKHGFDLENYRFAWDDAVDYSTQDMKDVEQMLLNAGYDIDPQYFIDKYNIPILERTKQDFFA